MGGILLICVLISIYLIVYWSIDIELNEGKTQGFFKFIPSAFGMVSDDKRPKKKVFSTTINPKQKIPQKIVKKTEPLEKPQSLPKNTKKYTLKERIQMKNNPRKNP